MIGKALTTFSMAATRTDQPDSSIECPFALPTQSLDAAAMRLPNPTSALVFLKLKLKNLIHALW
jgi:hypothetical protein